MKITLSATQKQQIDLLITKLQQAFSSTESEDFLCECQLESANLPKSLRKHFYELRTQIHKSGFFLLEGFDVDDNKIGETPQHWDTSWENNSTLREEIFQCLISCSLGEPFGWNTQENGRVLRNIVPIEADKNEQLGGSSSVPLFWHIEEAFHPHRAEMMTIMCYRNNERAGTNICSITQMNIPEQYLIILKQPRFLIEPDKSHFPENNKSKHWELQSEEFLKIKSFLLNPAPAPVISGPEGHERLVIDQAFMSAVDGDKEATEALEWLYQHMDEVRTTVQMNPGDVVFLDNRRVAHGRAIYKPNYGPQARWLRRINIAADLTKSFEWKKAPYARKIL
tara:strand:+ start:230 stop:1243 length:1014 start_codon:yes stop_codon:yes gene_type:complete